ncbi:hypothetical protein LCGC14_1152210 [marine sediment metagenome]|uniref:Uncharacterized protein n=1 Tax=marine sediment metagenome TaxID=412755 RepID=A0A0F9M016_9ZZZZ
MPDGTIGQTYEATPATPGKMLKSDDSILNLAQLLQDLLTAAQNIDIDIDSVILNNDEVESLLDQIRELIIVTNNLIAAGDADLAAIEALITAGNALLTTIDADTSGLFTTVGTIGGAHATGVAVLGVKAEGTVPPAVADGQSAALWGDLYGRIVQVFTDLATQTAMITDASPAVMQKQFVTDWATQTAPGDTTAVRGVRDYSNFSISYLIAAIGTSVGLIIWGSFDGGVSYHPIWSATILAADPQDDVVVFENMALTDIYCEFDAEDGGAPTVSWQMGTGNG